MEIQLVDSSKYDVSVKQFGQGAKEAGEIGGITVIIDNFRASNTILALLEAGAIVTPVLSIDEALKFKSHIKVGETGGEKHKKFDFDNSPYIISQNQEFFRGKKVVIRTTNGTRGIINARGSKEILVGSFRNLSAITDYCYKKSTENIPITFVAMGSLDIPRIEDRYGAKMMYYSLIEKLEGNGFFQTDDNPWNRNWVEEIKEERVLTEDNRDDRLYSLELDKTSIIPIYNSETNIIEILQ